MTLLEARMHGRLADTIFFPPSIHPDLRAMLNPELIRKLGPEGTKRKRTDDETVTTTPKRARIAAPSALDEPGFGDGGFGDAGFGDTSGGFGGDNDDPFFNPGDHIEEVARPRTVSPSLIDDEVILTEEEEIPTSVTGSMSHSTLLAAQILQRELPKSKGQGGTLSEITKKSVSGGAGVRREDAVRMFFEVLVLASRDVIRIEQKKGFGEIRVLGKEGLFNVGQQAQQSQIVV